jgi:putative DNA primase/helicase
MTEPLFEDWEASRNNPPTSYDPEPAPDYCEPGFDNIPNAIDEPPQPKPARAADLPCSYTRDAKGIWFKPPSDDDAGGSAPIFVSGPFDVLAETKDDQGASWGLLLRWHDRDQQPHQWAMPCKLLHADGNNIAAELEDAGLSVATGRRAHDLLKSMLAQIRTPNRMRCVNRSGWHQTDAGMVYVLPTGQAFGPDQASVILQSDKAVVGGDAPHARGTLAEWQEHIGKLAVKNDRVALFIAAALAAPLLQITTEPSGGIHLFGKSQDGKTTTLGVAASVWGKGDSSGQVRSWRATANGFEGIASETCDALLALDEISQADAREVGEVVYMLSNEAGKGRASRDGSARARRTWRILFLSTGEVPLATKMAERGNKPMAGQDIRLVSLPANAGGRFGVFQELHGHSSAAAFAVHLREAARRYYGTPAQAFLAKLAHAMSVDATGLAKAIAAHRARFERANVPKGADGQVSSVARRFALIAAAGELGVHFGILPWPKGEASRAARNGFQAWLNARGGSAAGEDTTAISTVRHFIELHGESRFTTIHTNGDRQNEEAEAVGGRTINRAGFRRQGAEGWEYLILPEAWKNEVCKGIDPGRAANVLKDAGFLVPGEGRHMMPKVLIAGYGRPRLFIVRGSILGG